MVSCLIVDNEWPRDAKIHEVLEEEEWLRVFIFSALWIIFWKIDIGIRITVNKLKGGKNMIKAACYFWKSTNFYCTVYITVQSKWWYKTVNRFFTIHSSKKLIQSHHGRKNSTIIDKSL